MAFETGETDGHDFVFWFIGIIILLMAFGTFLEGLGYTNISKFFKGDTAEETQEREELSLSESLLQSDLELGNKIANSSDLEVSPQPGGRPIGIQKKGKRGILMEGPALRLEKKWWRVDYEKAPDGWVTSQKITNKIGVYTALNIIPITLNFLKPITIGLSIIIFVLILIVTVKRLEFGKFVKKKEGVKKEQELIKKRTHGVDEEEHLKTEEKVGLNEDIQKSDESEESGLPIENLPVGPKPETVGMSNRRWSNIQSLINSYNINDWKQAIIEADTILDEMLDKMGYRGESIGEKLKQVEQSDFTTLNQAWEAHKIRNRIAHSGSNFTLSKDEAERILDLYKEVFSEFYYI